MRLYYKRSLFYYVVDYNSKMFSLNKQSKRIKRELGAIYLGIDSLVGYRTIYKILTLEGFDVLTLEKICGIIE